MKKAILAVVLIGALAFALTGCGKESVFGSEVIEETGATKIVADNANAKAEVTTEFAIEEGQAFMVSPVLEKGSIHVALVNEATGEEVFGQDFDGKILDVFDVAPGAYKLVVTCVQGGTTGSMVIHAVDKAEWEAQDEALLDTLEQIGVDPEILPAK